MTPIKIEVQNVGPIEESSAQLFPGVTVLRGRNGVGKTTILRAVQLVVDGRTDRPPTKKDGTPRGTARVGGKSIVVMRTVRHEGELSVEGVGDLSIADLHTPRFESAPTRDKHRIAALIRLAGVKADPALFHSLAGGADAFEQIVDADALKTDDLVEMAARVKRALEKHAQQAERDASSAEQRQAAEAASVAGVDISQPCDAEALAETAMRAVRWLAAIEQQRRDAAAALGRAEAARERLATLGAAPNLEAICKAEIAAAEASDRAETERRAAQEAYTRAEAARVQAAHALEAARERRESAEREAAARAELQRTIDAVAAVTRPSDDDLAAAQREQRDAHAAVEQGVRIRAARDATDRAERFAMNARERSKRAEQLRDAAADTLSVLSDAIGRIPNCPLRVAYDADGYARLVMRTNRSEAEPFDERSDGERWQTVLDIAAAADRVVVLPQAAWGELADAMRSDIDGMARERGCYVLTAQADDGELRAEPFAGDAS